MGTPVRVVTENVRVADCRWFYRFFEAYVGSMTSSHTGALMSQKCFIYERNHPLGIADMCKLLAVPTSAP